MKAVFIVYNQALTDVMMNLIDRMGIRGYTQWDTVLGRGTEKGEPHHGSHTWPSKNTSILTIVEERKVEPLLAKLRALDQQTQEQGTRAFVWNIEDGM